MPYCGETSHLTFRLPVELLERLDQQCRDFQLTRTTMVRTILELSFLTPNELRERYRRERAICDWIKAGMPEDTNPETEWNEDA